MEVKRGAKVAFVCCEPQDVNTRRSRHSVERSEATSSAGGQHLSHISHNLMITVSTVTSSFRFQLEPPSPPSLLPCYVSWLLMEDEHLRAPSIWDGLILLDIGLMVSWRFFEGWLTGSIFFFPQDQNMRSPHAAIYQNRHENAFPAVFCGELNIWIPFKCCPLSFRWKRATDTTLSERKKN